MDPRSDPRGPSVPPGARTHPHVDLRPRVPLAGEHLRGGVGRGPAPRAQEPRGAVVVREAPVGDLHVQMGVQQQVLRLGGGNGSVRVTPTPKRGHESVFGYPKWKMPALNDN